MGNRRLGIIDIGSNSVRLVIYEQLGQDAQRVIDESKQSERLSNKVDKHGVLPIDQLGGLLETLRYFKMVCETHHVNHIRAVATAAIRNAKNSDEVVSYVRAQSGLDIEVLSGHEEAFMGFVGVMNAMNVRDGFVVDIGGGSTEVTLFENRQLVESHSFPFGAVNMSKQFAKAGEMHLESVVKLTRHVEKAIAKHPWMKGKAGLPVIGLGGSFRSLGKIDQRAKNYSFPLTHQYEMSVPAVETIVDQFLSTPLEKRKKISGLAKDRADIIVPGVIILKTILRHLQADRLVISGAGLRDGVYYHTINSENPIHRNVVDASVRNLLANQGEEDAAHTAHVHKLASAIVDGLPGKLSESETTILRAATHLYRTGIQVDYYGFQKHTFYLVAFSRIYGFSHREKLMCALVAAFKSKNQLHQLAKPYRDLLSGEDLDTCYQLGTVLQMAIALDRSETQPIASLACRTDKKMFTMLAKAAHATAIEQREVVQVAAEFNKAWTLVPTLIIEKVD